MICEGNLVVIIDTNVLCDMLHNSNHDMRITIEKWFISILHQAKCSIGGRNITIATSAELLNDYKTGLSKRELKRYIGALKFLFGIKFRSKLKVSKLTAYCKFHRLNVQMRVVKKNGLKDSYDNKLLSLSSHVMTMREYQNTAIVLASTDVSTLVGLEKYFYKYRDRISFANSLYQLGECIKCSDK